MCGSSQIERRGFGENAGKYIKRNVRRGLDRSRTAWANVFFFFQCIRLSSFACGGRIGKMRYGLYIVGNFVSTVQLENFKIAQNFIEN